MSVSLRRFWTLLVGTPAGRVCLVYTVLGLALWPVPLLNVLQVESAAVVAFVSYFAAGWAALAYFRAGEDAILRVLGRQMLALGVPLGMLSLSRLWAPNCTYGQGLLFYALFPGITVVFAVALAYGISGANPSRPYLVLGGIGVLIGIGGPVYDLGFHPQFYTYNHVFGGILGPIYDEQLAVRPGLFAFRGLTLLWAGAMGCLGRVLRGKGGRWGLAGIAVGIAGMYAFAAPLGFNTTEAHLQAELGGHVRTANVDLYYDPDRLGRRAVEALADDHEAYYARLRDQLQLGEEETGRIQSYLYPNPDVKARLTGARYTSVSPVWLGEPQVHLLVGQAEASLGHELAHAVSRPYGVPGLRASWAPGLVEGWAVALEPPSPVPSPHDLVRVATTTDTTLALSLSAEALADRLTPWGFWTGRGAVSYATMGSFVHFLLEEYGAERLKQVYAWGNFETVYDRPLSTLVQEWTAFLQRQPLVARAAHEIVTQQFTRPSLFETECPHYVSPHRRHLQAAQRARRRGDSVKAKRQVRAALEAEPRYAAAHAALARRRLAEGMPAAVRRQLDTLAAPYQTTELYLHQADAWALLGEADTARRIYERAADRIPRYAPAARVRLLLRTASADRPAVLRKLTSDRSALRQAEALEAVAAEDRGVVQVWQALRYQDAHRYARADSLWRRGVRPVPNEWSRAERQVWHIQRRAWAAEAAYRAGHWTRAETQAQAAATQARALGAQAWAESIAAWAERAARAQGQPKQDREVHTSEMN